MILPKPLIIGDKIGITAPSRKINREDVEVASQLFATWGLNPVLAPSLFSTAHSYLAGTDDQRLEDIQQMIDDPEIKAIVCARGGYGSTRILDRINCESLRKSPKWLVGFSDVTAIHLLFLKNNIASIHGTMPILFSTSDAIPSVESLRDVLMNSTCKINVASRPINRPGSVKATTVGGNLSLIVDSLGTTTALEADGKILILEEIDEYFYKVDRMLTQLRRAGMLNNLKGLIIGHMTDIKETTLPFGQSVKDLILNVIGNSHYPVAFGFPSGHENPNLAWIQGGSATFDVNETGVSLHYDFNESYTG